MITALMVQKEWEEYRNQKGHSHHKQRKPNISLKSGSNSVQSLESVGICLRLYSSPFAAVTNEPKLIGFYNMSL